MASCVRLIQFFKFLFMVIIWLYNSMVSLYEFSMQN